MAGHYVSQIDGAQGQAPILPKSLLPPPDGPQETDLCEAEVASERYSYSGLMGMGGMRSSAARPRKRPVLLLDPEERDLALRQLDVAAVQDFAELSFDARVPATSGLSPVDAMSAFESEPIAPEEVVAEPIVFTRYEDTRAPLDFHDHAAVDAARPPEPEPEPEPKLEWQAPLPDRSEPEVEQASPASFWLQPMQPDDFVDADEDEDGEDYTDETRYGSLSTGVEPIAPTDVPEPRVFVQEEDAEPALADIGYAPDDAQPARPVAPAAAMPSHAMPDAPVAEPEQVLAGQVRASQERAGQVRAGHALRARVRAEIPQARPARVSLIGRMMNWLRAALGI